MSSFICSFVVVGDIIIFVIKEIKGMEVILDGILVIFRYFFLIGDFICVSIVVGIVISFWNSIISFLLEVFVDVEWVSFGWFVGVEFCNMVMKLDFDFKIGVGDDWVVCGFIIKLEV